MNESLTSFLDSWDVQYNASQIEQLYAFIECVARENKQFNLTSITNPQEMVEKHLVDSLAFFKVVPQKVFSAGVKLIDIGTGAGFPGIPLKILLPEATFFLADSTNKKMAFLKKVVGLFSLKNTACIADRAENLGKSAIYRASFDYAVARAVASCRTLAEYLLPLLKVNGQAVLYKGIDIDEELSAAKNAFRQLGGEVTKIEKFKINDYARSLIVINKVRATSSDYPRAVGVPKKNPL